VVEYFFSIYGISSLLIETAASRNHLAVLCSSVIIAVILSAIFIVTDLLYTLLNPKIKLLYTNNSHRKLREERAG
jgi:ABC-type dipeptide/oligopeptide/nickel transport system permease component